jgi:putative transposase
VRHLCCWLGVSAAGYYAWRRRQPSRRELESAQLSEHIALIFAASRCRYGSPRVHARLRAEGRGCSLNRCARLMRSAGLRAVRRRSWMTTTESAGTWRPEPNVLARRFRPGQVDAWAADLTAIRTLGGWLYLAVVLDLTTRRVLGWSMDSRASGQLALDALQMAVERHPPAAGVLHHSDRGGHYASYAYRAKLAQHGMVASMSRPRDCWDNAVVESFFATLKGELLNGTPVCSMGQSRALVFEYIETFYNRQRLHSSLGYRSPEDYAKLINAP